jgi:hypothetical protein
MRARIVSTIDSATDRGAPAAGAEDRDLAEAVPGPEVSERLVPREDVRRPVDEHEERVPDGSL